MDHVGRCRPRVGRIDSVGVAQNTSTTNTFDTDTSIASFVNWWGLTTAFSWDSTLDAGNDPLSGSVRYEIPFVGAGGEQIMTFFTIANGWGWDRRTMIDAMIYTNFSFDIKVDPSSGQRSNSNDYAWMEIGLVYFDEAPDPDVWGTIAVPAYSIPLTATNWTHVDRAIDPSWANLNMVVGYYFKIWSNGGHTNTLAFNLDNVMLTKPTAPVVIPPPTLSLTKPVPGLAFVAASGGQYDRQEIRTVGSNYTWVGASGPVSYSVDVAKIGETAPAPTGFTLFMHFVPGVPDITRPDSDWHETNVLMWTIGNSADGSAWSQLRYKTNAFEGNGDMWGSGGFPGGVWNATPAGTWTITFNQNTNIIITAPGGDSITNILPPVVVDIFNATPNMQINVGGVPGELTRLGQMAVITGVRITGTPGEPNLNSNFLGVPRDTNQWNIVASSPTLGVQEIPTDSAYWLKWTLPALNFNLQTATALTPGAWTGSTLPGYEVGGAHYVLFRQGDLPGSEAGYFRMMKRSFTRLQVLMPGETAAPGTPTGKTGTPTPQQANVPFSVIVNAVDDEWYPITGIRDTIHLTTDDPGWAGNPMLDPDPALANGTVTLNDMYLFMEGSWKITATDVTDPTKTADTGSATPVTP